MQRPGTRRPGACPGRMSPGRPSLSSTPARLVFFVCFLRPRAGARPMFIESQPADPRVHEAAIRMARRCRYIIQSVLREDEWADCDREFYLAIREELERLLLESNTKNPCR